MAKKSYKPAPKPTKQKTPRKANPKSARGKKKQEKKQQQQILQNVGIEPKAAKRLPKNERDKIITQEQRRQQRNAKQRAQYAENKRLIAEYGLQGVKPSDSPKKLQEAIKQKQEQERKDKQREQRAKIKERNREMLYSQGVPADNYPKGWQTMGEKRLQEWIDNFHVIASSTWLYIGWGDRSGNQGAFDTFELGYYENYSLEELREEIKLSATYKDDIGSSGSAGHTVIAYGKQSFTSAMMAQAERAKPPYQTIFHGNQISPQALYRYWVAALDNSPESNRKYICAQLNGYLRAADRPELCLTIKFEE